MRLPLLAFSLCLSSLALACGGDSFSASGPAAAGGAAGSAGQAGGQGGSGQGGAGQAGSSAGGSAGQAGGQAGAGQAGAGQAGSGQAGSGQAGSGAAGSEQGGAGSGGQGGEGGAGNAGGEAGAGGSSGGPPAKAIHVSPDGDDKKDGESPEKAVKTLPRALEAMQKAGRQEIHVCAGEFKLAGPLQLPPGATLRGGYDCLSFTKQSAPAPKANPCEADLADPQATLLSGKFEDPLLTLSEASSLDSVILTAPKQALVLKNSLGTIEKSVISIDQGSQPNPSVAAQIQGGSPTVRGNCFQGGSGEAKAPEDIAGSMGLQITLGSTAKLEKNEIRGGVGKGKAQANGSFGLLVLGASPVLTDNTINGGLGTTDRLGATASAGLAVLSLPGQVSGGQPTGPRISKNRINGGKGQGLNTQIFGSVGLIVACIDADKNSCAGLAVGDDNPIIENQILGGDGKILDKTFLEKSTATQIGLLMQGGAVTPQSVRIEGNTLQGGKGGPDSNGSASLVVISGGGSIVRNSILGSDNPSSDAFGAVLRRTKGLTFASNMVHTGRLVDAKGDVYSVGLSIANNVDLNIIHNTIVVGDTPGVATGIFQDSDDPGQAPTSGMAFVNNLLLGGKTNNPTGVEFSGCPLSTTKTFSGNLMVNFAGQAVHIVGAPAGCGTGYMNLGKAVQTIISYAKQTGKPLSGDELAGNVDGASSCLVSGVESACIEVPGCTTLNSCGKALFSPWDDASGGVTNLKDEGGFRLKPGATDGAKLPCDLIESNSFFPESVDRFGTKRTAPASRGAHEQDTCAE